MIIYLENVKLKDEYYQSVLKIDKQLAKLRANLKHANKKDIKQAYRKLARKHHPDANRDNQKEAEKQQYAGRCGPRIGHGRRPRFMDKHALRTAIDSPP